MAVTTTGILSVSLLVLVIFALPPAKNLLWPYQNKVVPMSVAFLMTNLEFKLLWPIKDSRMLKNVAGIGNS